MKLNAMCALRTVLAAAAILVGTGVTRGASAETVAIPAQRATVEIGLGALASDRYALLTAGTELTAGPVRAALHVPLRVRITDKVPVEAGSTPGVRSEDWDQPGDWARLLNYGEWHWKHGRLRVGELAGVTLGHGFVVDRFYNNLDFDRHDTGVRLDHDGGSWGAEAMLHDVVAAEIVAARAFARPAPTWTLGATAAVDRTAPRVRPGASGLVHDTDPLVLLGIDAGWELWRHGERTAVAYLDLALHQGAVDAAGVQVGVALHLPASRGVTVDARLGVRAQTPGQMAGWIDTAYALDRRGRKGMLPKLNRTIVQPGDDGAGPGAVMPGAALALDVRTRQAVQLSLALDADQAADGLDPRLQARLWLTVPDLAGLTARAMLAWRNDDPGDVLDGFVLAHAVLRYAVGEGPFFAATTAARRWRPRGADGTYVPETELTATAGAEVRF